MNVELSLEAGVGAPVVSLLRDIGAYFESQGGESYLVGGVIRDVLLDSSAVSADIDIMCVGDAITLVRELYLQWEERFPHLAKPRKPISFKHYGTAKLQFVEPLFGAIDVIDFAMARREHYPKSGAKPVVEAGNLDSDLARRDFSVNAMVVSLTPGSFGELVDHFDGVTAIERSELSILHNNSFVDDPARLIRAARFIARFSFTMSVKTSEFFAEAMQGEFLNRLPARRLGDELRKAFVEEDVQDVFKTLDALGICEALSARWPGIAVLDSHTLKLTDWQYCMALLFSGETEADVTEIIESYAFPKDAKNAIVALHAEVSCT